MINTHEMRIGNLVCYPKYWKGEDKIFHIRDIFFEGDYVGLTDSRIQTKVMTKFLKPIPLTEEWLLKFGFVKLNHLFRYEYVLYIDDKLNIEFIDGYGIRIVLSNENDDMNINIAGFVCYYEKLDIKTVHQLQNLFFAISGEELTIKNI